MCLAHEPRQAHRPASARPAPATATSRAARAPAAAPTWSARPWPPPPPSPATSPTSASCSERLEPRLPTTTPRIRHHDGTVRHPPRPGGRARLDRRQHRPDHPRPLPEADRADRLRPPALRRQALRARRGPRDRRPGAARRREPGFPAEQPGPRGRDDPGRRPELRLRLQPRARRLGGHAGRLPRGHRPGKGRRVRRHLRRQRLQQRPARHRALAGRLATPSPRPGGSTRARPR